MKPLAIILVGALAAGCSGAIVGPASAEVTGLVTWLDGTGMPTILPEIVVYDSTLGRPVRRSMEPSPPPRPYPRAGIVVQARPRYRGGLLQRFRWQSHRPVASDTTDSAGRYALRMPPGHYLVTAQLPSSFGCKSTTSVMVGGGLTVADRIAAGYAFEVTRSGVVEQDFRLGSSCPQ